MRAKRSESEEAMRIVGGQHAARKYTEGMILSLGLVAGLGAAATAVAQTASSPLSGLLLWGFSALAVLGYAIAFLSSKQSSAWSTKALMVGWGAHAMALVVDIFGGETGARFGFAPAISATVCLVIAAHAVEQKLLAFTATRRVLTVAGVVGCVLAAMYPGELRSPESPWAPLHWLLGIISYGLFGAAVVHAWLLGRVESRLRRPRTATDPQQPAGDRPALPLMTLERLTFRFVDAGFVALTITVLLGGWFALQNSHGWRWDHKTIFSLAGWLTFAFLVAGRHAYGWRGQRATRWVYVGAVLLMLAYVGSRFVLEVMLNRST